MRQDEVLREMTRRAGGWPWATPEATGWANRHRSGSPANRVVGLLVVLAMIAAACSGDDDAGDSQPSSPMTTEAAASNPVTTTAEQPSAATETREPTPTTEVDLPSQSGRQLFRGTTYTSTGDDEPTLVGYVELVVDHDTKTFSRVTRTPDGRSVVVGDGQSAYLGSGDRDQWIAIDLERLRTQAALPASMTSSVLDASVVDGDATYRVLSAVSSTAHGEQPTLVNLQQAWYLGEQLTRLSSVAKSVSAAADSITVTETLELVDGSPEVATPALPRSAVPVEAVIASTGREPQAMRMPHAHALRSPNAVGRAPRQTPVDMSNCTSLGGGIIRCGDVELVPRHTPTGDVWDGDKSWSDIETAAWERAKDHFSTASLIGGGFGLAGSFFALSPSTFFLGGALIGFGFGFFLVGVGVLLFWFALIHGDPHITSVDGFSYNLQSAGEFIYYRSTELEVQTRFEGTVGRATWTTGTAVRTGDHVVEVHIGDADENESGLIVRIDGLTTRLDRAGVHFDDGGFAALDHRDGVLVVAPTGDYVQIENRALSQNLVLASRPGSGAVGLAGTPNGDPTDDLTTRAGAVVTLEDSRTVEGLYARFGESWRVTPDERLFTDRAAEDFLTDEFLTLPDRYPSLANFPLPDRVEAEQQCRDEGVPDGPLLETCAFDLLADPIGDWAAAAADSGTAALASGTATSPDDVLDLGAEEVEAAAPILVASSRCDTDTVGALLEDGDEFTLVRAREVESGWTALLYATQDGCTETVQRLVEAGANVGYAVEESGVHATYLAAQNGHVDTLAALLDAGGSYRRAITGGETPLLAATYFGHDGVVEALLERGADPNVGRQADRFTPLIAAAQRGHAVIVDALLAAGAALEFANVDGGTALLASVNSGHIEIATTLIDAGARIDAAFDDGSTALHGAAVDGDLAIVTLLLAEDADPGAAGDDGVTPLFAAAQRGYLDVVAVLLSAGADPDSPADDGWTPLQVATDRNHTDVVTTLLDAGADPNARRSDGSVALISAAAVGTIPITNLLLSAGADPDLARDDGVTALHFAAQEGNDAVVDLLLGAGANIDSQSNEGRTPLHSAVLGGVGSTVQLLVERDADCSLATVDGATPADFAQEDASILAILDGC